MHSSLTQLLLTCKCCLCPPACCSLVAVPCCPHPPLLSRFVFSRGGPDRTLDLTYNKLYGQFPRFLVNQAADLSDSCLCATNFTVSAGNQLYCPTKDSLEGVKVTPSLLETFKQANYTCLLPKQKEPVSGAAVSVPGSAGPACTGLPGLFRPTPHDHVQHLVQPHNTP